MMDGGNDNLVIKPVSKQARTLTARNKALPAHQEVNALQLAAEAATSAIFVWFASSAPKKPNRGKTTHMFDDTLRCHY
jgi:hypothetical protein